MMATRLAGPLSLLALLSAVPPAFAEPGQGRGERLLSRLTDDLSALGYHAEASTVRDAVTPLRAWRGGGFERQEGETSERRVQRSSVRGRGEAVEARLVLTQDLWGLGGHLGWRDTRPSTWPVTTTVELSHDRASGVWDLHLETQNSYDATRRDVRLKAGPDGLRLADQRERRASNIAWTDTNIDRETTVLRRSAGGPRVSLTGVRRQSARREVFDHVKNAVTLRERRPGKVERIGSPRAR